MPWAWSSLITQLAQKEFYYPWNRTLVICPIPVLSWNRPTTGDQKTDVAQTSLSGRLSRRDQSRNKQIQEEEET